MPILKDQIVWLGHAGFCIKGSRIVYMDPYHLWEGLAKADAVLISHGHHDHCSPQDLKIICTPETSIYATQDCPLTEIPGKVTLVEPEKEYQGNGFSLKTIPAYNLTKPFHQKSSQWVGYILTLDGTSIYHCGDSDFVPEMEGLTVDFALLAVGGIYTMGPNEAARAFLSMNAKEAIPMHYGSGVGTEEQAQKFLGLIKKTL